MTLPALSEDLHLKGVIIVFCQLMISLLLYTRKKIRLLLGLLNEPRA